MRTTEDYHLKLDLNISAELRQHIQQYGSNRNRLINEAVHTYLLLLRLHRIYNQYQELGCNLDNFRADHCQYDFGELSWLLQYT